MKKSSLLFLIPLMLVFLITLVEAQTWLDNEISTMWISPIFALTGPTTWAQLIIVLVVFAIFLFGIQDIISSFTLFSQRTSWVIAGSLAIIGSLTGAVVSVARFFIYISLWAGTLSIFVAIITGFIAWMAIHLGTTWLGGALWAMRRQQLINAARGRGARAAAAIRMLEELRR